MFGRVPISKPNVEEALSWNKLTLIKKLEVKRQVENALNVITEKFGKMEKETPLLGQSSDFTAENARTSFQSKNHIKTIRLLMIANYALY